MQPGHKYKLGCGVGAMIESCIACCISSLCRQCTHDVCHQRQMRHQPPLQRPTSHGWATFLVLAVVILLTTAVVILLTTTVVILLTAHMLCLASPQQRFWGSRAGGCWHTTASAPYVCAEASPLPPYVCGVDTVTNYINQRFNMLTGGGRNPKRYWGVYTKNSKYEPHTLAAKARISWRSGNCTVFYKSSSQTACARVLYCCLDALYQSHVQNDQNSKDKVGAALQQCDWCAKCPERGVYVLADTSERDAVTSFMADCGCCLSHDKFIIEKDCTNFVGLNECLTPSPNGNQYVQARELLGVYCEHQVAHYCGVHALNAMLRAQVISDPSTVAKHLALSMAGFPPSFCESGGVSHFKQHGDYSVFALNHWLYEHTQEQVALVEVACIGVNNSCHTSLSQAEIMALCPEGCSELLMLYEEGGLGGHYKSWVKSADDWFECDSLLFTATNRGESLAPHGVRKLQPSDWLHYQGQIYCLVEADAYRSGLVASGQVHSCM